MSALIMELAEGPSLDERIAQGYAAGSGCLARDFLRNSASQPLSDRRA